MKRGFLLGKFMPPHAGHVFLARTAAEMVDELTILVCSLPDDPIDGAARAEVMRQIMPAARIVHYDKVVPQAPEESETFWPIWEDICRVAHPEPIDRVFGSEPYVFELARRIGGAPVIVDPDRLACPVSGTALRQSPDEHWHWLPGASRHLLQKRVALIGPESVGKTTLAQDLAAALNTIAVPEYGRVFDAHYDVSTWSVADFEAIAETHVATRKALSPVAGRLLIEDTDPLLTAIWQEMLIGKPATWALDVDPPDLYLLLDIDASWINDGTRYFGDETRRRQFFDRCLQAANQSGAAVVRIAGDWPARRAAALAAIAHFCAVS